MFFYENTLFGDENSYGQNIIENFNFPQHFHRSYELLYMCEGDMEVTIDDIKYKLKAEDVLLIFPNQIHSFKTVNYSKICLVIFSPEIVGYFYSKYTNLVPESNLVLNTDITYDDLKCDNIYLQKSVLYKALGMLTEQTAFKKANISGDFKLIHRILTFVEEHYSEDCTLKSAARVLKYDYAYLSKQFIKTMNMNYTEYLNRYRINRACYFISNENISIGDVYAKCGFENARSFNRNFKKYTNMTPSEYKDNVQNGYERFVF